MDNRLKVIDLGRVIPYILYLGAFTSSISIAGINAVIAIFTILFLYDLYKTKEWKNIDVDFSLFALVYSWKGITVLINGVFSFFVEIREIWDKFLYILIGRFSIAKDVLDKTLHTLFMTNNLLICWAILQKYFGAPYIFQRLWVEMFEERLIGYFGHPLHYGGYISLVFMVCLTLSIFYKKEYAYYLPLLLTGLVYSGSRSYFLSVALTVILITPFKSRKFFVSSLMIIPTLFAVYFFAFSGFRNRMERIFEVDFASRLKYWEIAWDTFKDNPFFGVGYNQLTFILKKFSAEGIIHNPSHAHNLYLQELAEGGVIGLLIMLFLFVYFMRKYLTLFKEEKERNPYLGAIYIGLFGCYINLAIAGIFEYNFGAEVVWAQLTFMMGLAEGFRKWSKEALSTT